MRFIVSAVYPCRLTVASELLRKKNVQNQNFTRTAHFCSPVSFAGGREQTEIRRTKWVRSVRIEQHPKRHVVGLRNRRWMHSTPIGVRLIIYPSGRSIFMTTPCYVNLS